MYVLSSISDTVTFPDKFFALIFQLIVFASVVSSFHLVLAVSVSVAIALYVPAFVAFIVPLNLYSALLSTPVCSSPLYVSVFPAGIVILFSLILNIFVAVTPTYDPFPVIVTVAVPTFILFLYSTV